MKFDVQLRDKEKYKGLVISWVKESYKKNREFFGTKPKITIKLIYSREEFDSFLPKNRPAEMKEWDAGFCYAPDKVFMFSPTIIEKYTKHTKENLKDSLVHEMSHAFHWSIVGKGFRELPVWWKEALASFMCDQTKKPKKIPDIFKLTQLNVCSGDMKYAYRAGGAFVKYLEGKYGEVILKKLAKARTKEELDSFFLEDIGKTLNNIFSEFRENGSRVQP